MTQSPTPPKPLRLRAQDSDDIAMLSSLCQDLITSQAQLHHDAQAKQFVLLGNRFCWERETKKRGWFKPRPQPLRVRSAVRFDYVERVQTKGLRAGDADTPLNLLAISAADDEAYAVITLDFSQAFKIALHCEVIDITLDDLSPPWLAQSKPQHD